MTRPPTDCRSAHRKRNMVPPSGPAPMFARRDPKANNVGIHIGEEVMSRISITKREFMAGGLTFTVGSFLPYGSKPAFDAVLPRRSHGADLQPPYTPICGAWMDGLPESLPGEVALPEV